MGKPCAWFSRILGEGLCLAGAIGLLSVQATGSHPFVAGAQNRALEISRGELLIGELNCVACHAPDDGVGLSLAPRRSPRLGEGGMHLTPQFLRAFLSDPQKEKPGTTMPDLLGNAHREEDVEALVHYLVSVEPEAQAAAVGADPVLIQEGRVLFHQVGCVACHGPLEPASILTESNGISGELLKPAPASSIPSPSQVMNPPAVPLGKLAHKTTVRDLAKFLMDPLKTRPSGRMPSFRLTDAEATAIAMYLLRDQVSAADQRKMRGLSYQYFEANFGGQNAPDFSKLIPVASGNVEQFGLAPRKRAEHVGLRFSGFISITVPGEYTFFTMSDDASRLLIDGRLVVNNDGQHAAVERQGKINLAAGDHPISVLYFNAGGPAELKVMYKGPEMPKREISGAVLSHLGHPMVPIGMAAFEVDPEKAKRGRGVFHSVGCAACHSGIDAGDMDDKARTSKPLSQLNLEAPTGCLGNPAPGVPRFSLTEEDAAAIRNALNGGVSAGKRPTAEKRVDHALAAFNCYACHERDGHGGPDSGRTQYFTAMGETDLGEEGRIPPHLNGVGAKLKLEWLNEVLVNGASVRPYMAVRMPAFGQNISHLAAAFAEADHENRAESELPETQTLAKWGRKLVGTSGLSCVACHNFGEHKSLGIPAMDLLEMPRRLRWEWFRQYMIDPQALRPGTRMPSFWPEGQAVNEDILDGDTSKQLAAIWGYLSMKPPGGIPDGLIQGEWELTAEQEPIIYRHFIAGADTRAIGVGYPEKANLAFDANAMRLALIWQGPFIDAAKHRAGRGPGFQGPLGYKVIAMPPGPPFAILHDRQAPWPDGTGSDAGYGMSGYQLDEARRPKFLYSFRDVAIEDYPIAVADELDPFFRRTLLFRSNEPMSNMYYRAAVGSTIERESAMTFIIDGTMRMTFSLQSGEPFVRKVSDQSELVVPIEFEELESRMIQEIVW